MNEKPSAVARLRAWIGSKAMAPVSGAWRNHWRLISEPFTGAWQRNKEEVRGDVLTYPTLYACLARISTDVGKLPFSYRARQGGIWKELPMPEALSVLRKPNRYQTQAQLREAWMLSKLVAGNAYVLKGRDAARVVRELYVLDPCRVMPMVSDSGEVFYQLQSDKLNKLPEGYPAEWLVVPASEIIHDRCAPLYHPLIGVPPVAAAAWPAIKNTKILRNATEFFGNNAQPGGLLSAPAGISDADAKTLKDQWEAMLASGNRYGQVAVVGADMKFTPFGMKSVDAQMIEQMRYSDEQICQPFGIPPYKVGIGSLPSGLGVDGVSQMYYADALQTHIEHMEALLTEGLEVAAPHSVELDLAPLLRMDEGKRAEVETKLVQGMIRTPNEARLRFNDPAVEGGDTLWGQNQDYPLGILADRRSWDPALQPAAAAPAPEPEEPTLSPEQRAYLGMKIKARYEHETA